MVDPPWKLSKIPAMDATGVAPKNIKYRFISLL